MGVHVKVFENGRITLPAKMREELGIQPGDTVTLELDGRSLRLQSYKENLREAQRIVRSFIPEGRILSDELIAERRAEAARE